MPLTTCIKSLDCRLYTLLDKNDTDSLTFCVVTRETRACTAFTCTCPNERNPRSIETNQFTRNSTSILGITKPICKFKSILDEKMFDITQTKFTNTENCSDKNMVEYTTTMGIPFKYNCMELKVSENSIWLYILIFVLGVGIGTVFGGLATFIWFKRRYLQPKTSPAVTEIYNRETARMSIHDVTEYSEIPECNIKTHSEETNIVKYQEDIMECPVGVDTLNHSSKEEIKPIMDAAHGDIDKISVYFELSAVSESEKLFASECTDSVIKDQCKHVERSTVETKHFNTERNAASVCKNGDDNPKDIVYFELSKATI